MKIAFTVYIKTHLALEVRVCLGRDVVHNARLPEICLFDFLFANKKKLNLAVIIVTGGGFLNDNYQYIAIERIHK